MPAPKATSEKMRKRVEQLMDYLLDDCKTVDDKNQAISYWLATGLHHQKKLKESIEPNPLEDKKCA